MPSSCQMLANSGAEIVHLGSVMSTTTWDIGTKVSGRGGGVGEVRGCWIWGIGVADACWLLELRPEKRQVGCCFLPVLIAPQLLS